MKKQYKELQKKLVNIELPKSNNEFGLVSNLKIWLNECDIKPSIKTLTVIYYIFKSAPYVHQEQDRLVIINYLQSNKYKQFKKDFK